MSVHVLRCPNCGADLEVADGSATIRCRYCRAHCRVEGVGTTKKLTAEEEAAWNGLIEEAKKIDLDALESGLENLKQIHKENLVRSLWDAATDSELAKHEQINEHAQKIVDRGEARAFLSELSKMPPPTNAEDRAVRQIADRVAARVALLLAEQSDHSPVAITPNLEEEQTTDLWEALAANALGNEADVDALAQQVVSQGNALKFLSKLSNMPPSDDVEVRSVRQVVDRVAAKVEILLAAQMERKAEKSGPDDATRRAAAAQEVAANEAALAARLVAAREMRQLTEEVEQSKRNLAALQDAERLAKEAENQQEADRTTTLALRSQYRMSRVWAIVSFPVVMVCVGAAGLGLAAWKPADWVMTLGRLLFFGSPFVALVSSSMKWGRGTEAGRKFNEVAPLFGLPEVAVKTKSQQEARGCTHETAGGCGCVAFLALAVGLWAVDYFGLYFFTTNTPSPATNSAPKPPSNSAPPSNSPAGNTAPPANGESAPANNAPRSD